MRSSSQNSRQHAVTVPPGFNFWRTVYSHGWCVLPPFATDSEQRTLTRVFSLAGGVTALGTLRSSRRTVTLVLDGARPRGHTVINEILEQARTCLRLDEDLSAFHREARRHPDYRWIATSGAGRMLRAPTMFEDAVKMICTTNCTWALTTLMVTNLVTALGARHNAHVCAFPSPAAIAGLSEATMRREIKAGYRSPFLIELAERVASGRLDLEAWRRSSLSTRELFKEMLKVKGIGPYAAGNLLKLAGRYDELGLDSWVRSKYSELHHGGRKVRDVTITRAYAPYGRWQGLFFWLEMTRDWHQEKFRL